jgi:molecular chaperone IbpA
VKGAKLNNGLLTVTWTKEVPEALKPQRIAINGRLPDSAESTEHRQIKAA